MIAWPEHEMERALDFLIERRMNDLDIRGAAVAVVVDGKLVFERGYGVGDIGGEVPVTEHTLFEAASLGKPIVAFGALLLARERKLALDAPVTESFDSPWLKDAHDRATVTPRHLLTHRSGLSNNLRFGSRSTGFEPGSQFSYSGVGYMYLAEVMAGIEETGFDRLMRERVFAPLGMHSSGYTVPEALVDRVARPHVPLWMPIVALVGPALCFLAILGFLTLLIVRFGFERLRVRPVELLPAVVLSPLLAGCLVFLGFGFWVLIFSLGYLLVWLVALSAVAFSLQYLRVVLDQGRSDRVISRGRMRRHGLDPAMLGIAFVASLLFMFWQVPGPMRNGDDLNPASSLRSSAHDLGLFMAGFINGAVIGPEWRARMVSERVEIGTRGRSRVGWGLGFGTRETATSFTAWQWGSNVGSKSLMVIDPSRRAGVVVLTNAESGDRLVQEVAGHVLGIDGSWRLP
ncbi:MAG: serine hydrolase domain-containing protein [Parvibaculum sp.]|uniref:serine hydrolase domain-containing protein n=1 Tax=Parvibaculum sp. TaxID=2024848 RepID=UPI002731BB59|nr:serine hydrolase domain-containing protein [Parvibaculum sp.]MDP1625548.1 serine hydrolase domain-containing protein [Parvibaculum sp.]